MTDWKILFGELLLAVEDARRNFDDLDAERLEFDATGKTAKVVGREEVGGDYWVELFQARELFDDLLEDWRRKLYVGELQDAREVAA